MNPHGSPWAAVELDSRQYDTVQPDGIINRRPKKEWTVGLVRVLQTSDIVQIATLNADLDPWAFETVTLLIVGSASDL